MASQTDALWSACAVYLENSYMAIPELAQWEDNREFLHRAYYLFKNSVLKMSFCLVSGNCLWAQTFQKQNKRPVMVLYITVHVITCLKWQQECCEPQVVLTQVRKTLPFYKNRIWPLPVMYLNACPHQPLSVFKLSEKYH